MARVTIEDCLKKVKNRFELVHLASSRVRQLVNGSQPLIICDNKEVVTALREIAADKVTARLATKQELDDDNLTVELPPDVMGANHQEI